MYLNDFIVLKGNGQAKLVTNSAHVSKFSVGRPARPYCRFCCCCLEREREGGGGGGGSDKNKMV